MGDRESVNAEYASPPCFMHELDPAYSGALPIDQRVATDVARWRKSERSRLISRRMAAPAEVRKRAAERIAVRLDQEITGTKGRIIGIYWPFRGEPDLREWGATAISKGARLALPVVVAKGQPLVFRTWALGEKLEKGVWNLPVPAGGKEVSPDIA